MVKPMARDVDFRARDHYKAFEVVEDMIPVESGGFIAGTRFSAFELRELLDQKLLAKQTRIMHIPSGELYFVDYDWQKYTRRTG